jgi:DNA-binding HxlR family transcriptional regulator
MKLENEVEGVITCDIWHALRKFSNKNITQIADALRSGPLTMGELRDITGISTNILNHSLIEMRNADLVKKIESKYYMTVFGKEILESLEVVLKKLHPIPKEELFKPCVAQDA